MTVRAIGLMLEMLAKASGAMSCGTTPADCLKPTTPLQAAGMRVEPPASVPTADRAHAGGERDRGAARGAAAGAVGRPGVARAAEQRRLGVGHVPELGRRGLADQDGAGALEARDRDGVLLGHVVLVDGGGERRAHALGVDEVLDVERHAVQGTELGALREGLVGGGGIGERLIRTQGDEAVAGGLHLLGARQRGAHHLDGGDFAWRGSCARDRRRRCRRGRLVSWGGPGWRRGRHALAAT